MNDDFDNYDLYSGAKKALYGSDSPFASYNLQATSQNETARGHEFNEVYSDDFGNYNVRAKALKPLKPIKPSQKNVAKGPRAAFDASKKAANPTKKPTAGNFLNENRKPKAAANAKNSKPAASNVPKPSTQRPTDPSADRFQLKDYSMPRQAKNQAKAPKQRPNANYGDDDPYGDDPLDMYQLDPFIAPKSHPNQAGNQTMRRQNFQNYSHELMGENTNQNTHLHHQYQQQQLYGSSQNHSLPNLTQGNKSKIPRLKDTTNSLGRLNNYTARRNQDWDAEGKPMARRTSPRVPEPYSPYELIPQTPLLVLSSMNNHMPPENLEPIAKPKKHNKLPAIVTFDPDDNDPSSLLNQGRTTSMKAVGALKNPNINEYLYSLSKKDGPKMGYVEQFKEAQRRKTKWHHVGFNFKEYQKFRDNAGFGHNFLDPYGITEPNEVRAEKANKRNEYAKYVRDKNFGVYTKYNHEFKSTNLYDMYEPETYRHVNRNQRF